MRVGERIRNRRLELGLSVDDLAQKLGKNRATVYRYENNDIENMPTSVIEPLSIALQTTPAYLMGWNEKEKEIRPSNIQDELAKFIDRLDPSTGLAFFNGETEMDQETRELILMSLKNTLALSQKLSQNKEKQNED